MIILFHDLKHEIFSRFTEDFKISIYEECR